MDWIVADTHALLWFLENDHRLSSVACAAMERAQRILVPSIALVEITYLIEKSRLHSAVLPRILTELDNPVTTLYLAPLDLGVVLTLEEVSREAVPDMPDRIIAATAVHYCLPVVSRDRRIQKCGIQTIW